MVNKVAHPQTVHLDQTVVVPAHGSATYAMVIERCTFQTQFSISWRPTLTAAGQELWGAESFEAAVLAMASLKRLPLSGAENF
ncbi:MAG: hypothetical protein HC921_19985 [Synechococcaceae cyanobacterium SM2_3_1]|nr:hypothetical protein [Synechococcaceae cyanobacterium SM2_3_1]